MDNRTFSMWLVKDFFVCQRTSGRSPTSSKGNWKGGGKTDRQVANKKLKISLMNSTLLDKIHENSKTYIHTGENIL